MICTIATLLVLVSGCEFMSKDTGDSVRQSSNGQDESDNEDDENQIVFKYKESEIGDTNLSKTVYEDNQVTLFLKDADNFTDFSYITCFDKNFKVIDCEWDVKLKKNKLIIRGKKANKISGIEICARYNSEMLELRYLDSDQFAQLTSYWADDLGWDTYGDEEAFYTKEELDARKERSEAIKQKNDEVFYMFEGAYVCEDNPDLYIEIYDSENGRRFFMNTINARGEDESIFITIDYADIRERYGAYDGPVVTFTEVDALSYDVVLMYSEDYNTLWQYDGGPVFTRVQHE